MKTLIAALVIVGALTTPARSEEKINEGTVMMVALVLLKQICGLKPSEVANKGGEFYAKMMGEDRPASIMWGMRMMEAHEKRPDQTRALVCPSWLKLIADAEKIGAKINEIKSSSIKIPPVQGFE